MEEENKETKEDVITKTKEEVAKLIKQVTESGLQVANVELLYKGEIISENTCKVTTDSNPLDD